MPRLRGRGTGRGSDRLDDPPFQIQELVEARQEQMVLIESGQAAEDLLEEVLAPLKRLVIHHDVADGQCPQRRAVEDEGERSEHGQRRGRLGHQIRPESPGGQLEAVAADLVAQVAMALSEQESQPEQTQLLGVRRPGQHRVVVLPAPLGLRLRALTLVAPAGMAETHQHAGDRGDEQDGGGPPVERHEHARPSGAAPASSARPARGR